ncbi:vacuolating cytotoxin domain-containing protein [Helicobacter canis]|uniref:vacuolating cytotoxin domain-containing protein n=1 Tax=Helicobacter canis TaxID=29419 RepID=UPI0015F0C871|nr:vacuolating cytotoxin domain-containing protein [Helicobacter canis]
MLRSSVLCAFCLSVPSYAQSAQDIGGDVYRLSSTDKSEADIFYAKGQNPYSITGSNFTQNYNNGTLVFGNTQKAENTNRDDGIHFGNGGWTGYVTGTFNAKEVYLTSRLGTGNNTGAGAGATLVFNASENLTAQGLTVDMWSNTQGDSLTLTSQHDIALKSSNFKIKGSNSELKISAKNKLEADNFTLEMPSNSEKVVVNFSGDTIEFKNSKLNIAGPDIAWNKNETKFSAESSLSFADTTTNIQGDSLVFESKNGDIKISGGSTTLNSGTLSKDAYINFTAGKNIDIANLTATLFSGKGQFIAKAGENLSIKNLNLHGNVGTAVNETYATFEANTINLDKAEIYSTRGINNATDNAGAFVVKFIAKDSITLKDTNIKLTNQLEGVGSADYAVFESGGDLTHTGKLTTATAQQTWGGATFDFSKVKGKASVGDMEIVAANVKMNKDFAAKSLVVQKRNTNGGQDGLGTKLWAMESGKYKFDSITLNDGTDLAADTARMTFVNESGGNAFVKDSTLELGSLSVGVKGGFYASNIHHTTATNITLHSNSTASFHNLTLTPGGQIIMDATNTQLVLDNQFINGKNEAGVLELGVSIKDSNLHNGYGKPILAITNAGNNLENIHFKAGEVKRLIDAGEIKYNFVDSSGQTSLIHCDGSEKEKCESIKNLIGIYAGNMPTQDPNNPDYTKDRFDLKAIGLKYEKVLTYNYIGLKISSDNANNPYQIGDIRYYLYEKCGQECIEQIGSISNTATITQGVQTQLSGDGKEIYVYEYTDSSGKLNKIFCNSNDTEQCKKDNKIDDSNGSITLTQSNATQVESDVYDWLNFLSIYDKGITWTGANVLNYDLDFFLQTANQLNNTLDQLASIDRKTSTSSSTRLAADIARSNRLVKLSNFSPNSTNNAFAALKAKALAKLPHYAESSTIASDATPRKNPAFLYKFSNRHDFMNNIWATGIGSTTFVKNGHGTLYGLNAGYDRFIPLGESGLILGASTSYGYGTYNADLLTNHSHNVNAGFYSRAFIANHEIDFTANYTLGINTEDIKTRENPFLRSLEQGYAYNTHAININANYGYIFGTNNKSLVFKPMGGLSYYYISVGELNGGNKFINANPESTFTPNSSNIAIQSPDTQRHLLALNLALETRQYFSQSSYWFINIGAQKDLYISNGNRENVRFVGNNSLSYRSNDGLNTHLLGTAGGEVLLGKQTFINFALGSKIGLSYKDINLTANLGVRYVF